MKKLLMVATLFISLSSVAQKFTIKGQLVDSVGQSLPGATVLLLNPSDSSLVNFSVSDPQGNFEIKNVNKGKHLFKVTFLGFRTFTKEISTSEAGPIVDLGKVTLLPKSNELEAVEIEAEKAPVVVKKDTIEFNATSFKTKQNAMVEDLLKKLPGIDVDNEGNITAQGEQVRRVTVDGKDFFGSDPKLATKSLPADAIDKVQVFDKKSDQAAFSGIDDGQREKTINLQLKEEKRKGAFGTLMAGVGDDSRFQAKANINRFTKEKQFSFIGMGNNVNQQGFSIDDYMNFTGGSQRMMSGGAIRIEFSGDNSSGMPLNFGNRANGIMSNYAGGVNMNNQFNKKSALNASYFYNYLDHNKSQTLNRLNTLPGENFSFNQNSVHQNTNENHRLNFTLDHKIDSLNSLRLTGNVSYNSTDSEMRSQSETITSDSTIQNSSEQLNLSSGTNASVNTSLLWRHRFNKKGRTFSANLQFIGTENKRSGFLNARNNFFGDSPREERLLQENEQSTANTSYGATLSYTEPLGKRKYFEANYSYRRNLNDVSRDVYDVGDDQPVYNTTLSNVYTSDYQYHRGGFNFRMNKTKYNLLLGGSVQKTLLNGNLKIQNTRIEKSYENVLPSVRFNYDFASTRHLRFDYETSVQEPGIQQLQPVVDNSDPLNPYSGNPDLRPAYLQSWRVNFNTFNPLSFVSFFVFVDVDYIRNAITNARSVSNFVTLTSPVNVDYNRSVTADATVSFPIQKLKSRVNFSTNYRSQRTMAMLNEVQSEIDQQTVGGTIRYNFRYKEILDLNLSADKDYQISAYGFNADDQVFINSTYTAEMNLTFLKNFQAASSFEYLEYENRYTGFQQSIPLLNMSVSFFMLKNKSGELKFSVNNLLDKALGVNQMTSLNYLEQQTTNSLGRYFMISFIYSLNKQLNPMGMRRGGVRILR